MVLYTTNSTTGEPEKAFSKDNILLVSNNKHVSVESTVSINANSLSVAKIDCRNFKSIRMFGTSSLANSINLAFSETLNGTYRNVDNKLTMTNINSVNTFSIELNNTPNYISFYNTNSSNCNLILNYVLYS
jgi:hypothetical protein